MTRHRIDETFHEQSIQTVWLSVEIFLLYDGVRFQWRDLCVSRMTVRFFLQRLWTYSADVVRLFESKTETFHAPNDSTRKVTQKFELEYCRRKLVERETERNEVV